MRAENIELQLPARAARGEVRKQPVETGRRMLPPAAFAARFACGVIRLVAILHTALESAFQAPERTTGAEKLIAVKTETILELHGDRAAQRVQPENWIRAFNIHARDSNFGDQIPVNTVPKRMIETNATGINRQPLCIASERRRLETAIEQVRLEWIVLRIREGDSRRFIRQRPQQVRSAKARNLRR